MHCYSGSVETAKQLLDLGMYFSFSGTLTFKNAARLREVAKYLPADRILTETDSPYLAPEPFRGRENRPLYVKHVLAALAEIRGEDVQKMEDVVWQNTLTLFPKIKERL
jgi:TatD DNase family protein